MASLVVRCDIARVPQWLCIWGRAAKGLHDLICVRHFLSLKISVSCQCEDEYIGNERVTKTNILNRSRNVTSEEEGFLGLTEVCSACAETESG